MYSILLSDNKSVSRELTAACDQFGCRHRVVSLRNYDTSKKVNPGYKKVVVVVPDGNDALALCKAVFLGQRYHKRAIFINATGTESVTFDAIRKTFKVYKSVLLFNSIDGYVDYIKPEIIKNTYLGRCLLPPYKPLTSEAVCTVCKRHTCAKVRKREAEKKRHKRNAG